MVTSKTPVKCAMSIVDSGSYKICTCCGRKSLKGWRLSRGLKRVYQWQVYKGVTKNLREAVTLCFYCINSSTTIEWE